MASGWYPKKREGSKTELERGEADVYIIHRLTSRNNMVRTQIYLTEKERTSLQLLAEQTGKTQSQLIRDAIDRLIGSLDKQNRLYLLRQARGMWKDRDDLPDFEELRKEFDRFSPRDE